MKFDPVAEEPILDRHGRVQLCDDDEVGEILGCINAKRPNQAFTGYTNAEATKKKIIEGAFRGGDQFFRSGDLMRMDSSGFIYFVDRIGDTFRWKGENVSTNEVADALSRCGCVEEANVYGVQLPNTDGRIGMAAVVFSEGGPNWKQLAEHVKKELPSYAIPYFVRPLAAQEITGTFKHRKVELVKEGWTAGADPVFFYGENQTCHIMLLLLLLLLMISAPFNSRDSVCRRCLLQLHPNGPRPEAPDRVLPVQAVAAACACCSCTYRAVFQLPLHWGRAGVSYFHQKLTLKLGVNERT